MAQIALTPDQNAAVQQAAPDLNPQAAPSNLPGGAPALPASAPDSSTLGLPPTAAQPSLPTSAAPAQPAAPATGLSAAPAPQTFAQKLAASLNRNSAANGTPGGWAKSLVGGAVDAISTGAEDAATGIKENPLRPGQSGALAGVMNTLAARQQRIGAEKQQSFDNAQKLRQQDREDQKAALDNAMSLAQLHNAQLLTEKLGDEAIDKNVTRGKSSFDSIMSQAAVPEVYGENVTAAEAQKELRDHNLSSMTDNALPTGRNQNGEILYTTFGKLPDQKLSPDDVKRLNDIGHPNSNKPYEVGQPMSGSVYNYVIHTAASVEAQTAARDKALADAKVDKDKTDQKLETVNIGPEWNNALAHAGNDPVKAETAMLSNPAIVQKYPHLHQDVVEAYGGQSAWKDVVDNQTKQQAATDKAKDEAAKKALTEPQGDTDLTGQAYFNTLPPDHKAVVQQIADGRMPLQQLQRYVAKNPGVISEVALYDPSFDASKIGGYVKASTEFTTGKPAIALNSANTTMQHLKALQDMNNTPLAFIPHTKANDERNTALNDASTELARFLNGGTQPSEKEIASARDSLDPSVFGTTNPQAAKTAVVTDQAERVNEKIKEYQEQWDGTLPSPNWKRPMPGLSATGRDAYGALTGNAGAYAGGATIGGQNQPSQKPQAAASKGVFDPKKWAAANPGKDVTRAIAQAKVQGYTVTQ